MSINLEAMTCDWLTVYSRTTKGRGLTHQNTRNRENNQLRNILIAEISSCNLQLTFHLGNSMYYDVP